MVRVIWKWYGQIGVPVFLIIGGYLFHGSDGEKRTFWKKKFKRLIVPWMICGTMPYLLYVFRIRTFNALSWLKWVLGSGTWLYYATIYFCLLILFELFAIHKNEKALIACIIITALMLTFEAVDSNFGNAVGWFTPYLNILNWIGFFSLGALIKKKNLLEQALNQRAVFLSTFVFLLSIYLLYRNWIFTYFHILSALMEYSAFIILLNISYLLARKPRPLAIKAGESTYFIFLVHMQIVQFLCNRLPDTAAFDFLRPVVGLVTMMIITFAVEHTCKKSKKLAQIPELIGL